MFIFDWFQKNKKAERKALVIGCSNYKKAASIPGIHKSAVAIRNVLRRHYDKTDNFDVTLYTEDKYGELPYSSEKDLLRKIHQFLRSGHKADTGILYIISHGSRPEAKSSACLVFPGSPWSDGDDIFIPMDVLAEEINKSGFGNLVVVIDCCFAGSFIKQLDKPLRPGVSILTSSDMLEKSWGGYYPFSDTYTLFSGFMKAALRWKAADNLTGVTTLASVYDFLCQNLGFAMHPVLRCNATTFLPLRQNRPNYAPEQMRLIHDCFARTGEVKPKLSEPLRFQFREAAPAMVDARLVSMAEVITPSGRKKHIYTLTPRGRRLWDLMEIK